MSYQEHLTGVPGVVVWTKDGTGPSRILPDGCLDLVWDGTRLTVAGPALDELWPSSVVRRLTEGVADGGGAALTAWVRDRRPARDPLGARVLRLATAGTPVAAMADQLGLSARQLHRRCLPLFGYGPRHLSRVLRLQRAASTPGSLADVAHASGYADQAHLSREARDLTGTTPTVLRRDLAR